MERQLKRFSDFAQEGGPLDGTKLKIDDILNKEIMIIGFKMKDSKYAKSNSSKCLTIQFELDGNRHVVFTGSSVLIEQIEKYQDKIPFLTIIKKIDRYYTFS
jgi:hypothetical protein